MIHTTQRYKIGDTVELLKELPSDSIDTIVTSPPYWGLRDYGVDGQIGLEPTLKEYHTRLLEVTSECMRVLKPTGVMFWNHGDSYGGSCSGNCEDNKATSSGTGATILGKSRPSISCTPKCMVMQNERLIIKMVDEQGWILRNRIIWNKPNGMPSSVGDRFSNKYEPVYMLVKSKERSNDNEIPDLNLNRRGGCEDYWFDLDAVRVPHSESSIKRISQNNGNPVFNGNKQRGHPTGADTLNPKQFCHRLGKNPGDVWTIPTQSHKDAHFAMFPDALIEPMIRAACPAEICPVCGFARERIVDTESFITRPTTGSNTQKQKQHPECSAGLARTGGHVAARYTTIGWTSCDCGAGWISGTVLDPFAGSGTVGYVARNLNRNAILFELNPEYGKLIANRIMEHTPPLTTYFGDG